jgi:hypothetical protein
MAQSPGRGDLTSSAGSRQRVTCTGLSVLPSKQSTWCWLSFAAPVGMWATPLRCPHIHRPAAPRARSRRYGGVSRAQWRDDNLPIGRHGADLNCQARVRRRAPHGAEHACRGIIPPVADGVHAAAWRRRRKGRPGCSCALAAKRRYSSAAAATAARFTVPAAVRGRSGIRLSAPPAGATRRAAAVG